MARRATAFIILVCAGALASGVVLYLAAPSVSAGSTRALLLLSVLAVVAETLALVVPNSASGSLAFIPYLASAIISPSWQALVAVAGVKTIVDSVRRVDRRTALFNVAQHTLTLSAAIWTFRSLGGHSLLELIDDSFLRVTAKDGVAALVAFAASFALNGIIVCYFLALRSEKSFRAVWRQSVVPTIGMDIVAGPVVFIFAWLCAAHGPIAAAALWVPILGLREVHRVNLELQKTNQELLQLMVKSIEARDTYTSGHSRRVQHYSIIIARSL